MPSNKNLFQSKKNSKFGYIRSLYQKPVVQVSTALLLTVFTTIFFAVFAIRPTLSTIAQLLKKIEDQKKVEQKLNQKVAALATAHSEYTSIESKLHLIENAIPQNHTIDKLTTQIESTAVSSNTPIETIQINNLNLASTPNPENQISTLSYSINTAPSSFDQLESFLNNITYMQRATKVVSINLTQQTNEQQESSIQMLLQIQAFYMPK